MSSFPFIFNRSPSVIAGLYFGLAATVWANMPSGDRVGFDSLTPDSGLSSGVISGVIQDSKGLVWAATDYGLNQTDYSIFNDSTKTVALGFSVRKSRNIGLGELQEIIKKPYDIFFGD